MDIIILGFLMMKPATLYELGQFVENYLSSISSNSRGSIQAGIKKLSGKGLVSYQEQVENGVNKKVYRITASGRTYFEENISTSMLYKEKNMELSKFFFMGFTDKAMQKELIGGYIKELEKELAFLQKIEVSLEPRYDFSEYISSADTIDVGEPFTLEKMRSIARFQYATLDFGMDKLKFEIEWFQRFQNSLDAEDDKNEFIK